MNRVVSWLAGFLFLLMLQSAIAADLPGSGDHPLVPRYPGSEICAAESSDFDRYELVSGPALTRDEIPVSALEGRVTRNMYVVRDESRTALEVMRNYQIALKEAGFTELFSCGGDDCVEGASFKTYFFFRANPNLKLRCRLPDLADWGSPERDPWYFSARLSRPGQPDTHVAVVVAKWALRGGGGPSHVFAQVDVVEAEAMQVGMELKLAEEIDREIQDSGRAAIYGIRFSLDSDVIEPSSTETLEQIARYLRDHTAARLLVVGHTDDQGSLEYNQDLSLRRARSVVVELVERYGISGDRLQAHGVGFLAPAAANSTEEGRAINRRVELVPDSAG